MATYAQLVADLKADFEDDFEEFAAFIPTAVRMAHARMDNDFDTQFRRTRGSISVVAGTSQYNLPSDCMYLYSLYLGRTPLERKTESFIYDFWPDVSVKDTPKYYAMPTATTLILAPTPVASGSLEISYEARTPVLSDSITENIYSKYMYNALYHATAIYMAHFVQSASKAQEQQSMYEQALSALGVRSKQETQDEGTPSRHSKAQVKDSVVQGS